MKRPQFTIKRMLIAVSWFCLGAAILAWALRDKPHVSSDVGNLPEIIMATVVSVLTLPAIFGAGIGVFFGKARWGFGIGLLAGVLIVAALASYSVSYKLRLP